MSELDDLIARDRAERESREETGRLSLDHGPGWRAVTVHPALAALTADFVSRLRPDAGSDAYWVTRLPYPTVHLPAERVPLFSGRAPEHKAAMRRRAKAMRAESRGPARLLTISVEQNDAAPTDFSLIRFEGQWLPAARMGDIDHWSSGFEFDHADAKRAMVQYLRGG